MININTATKLGEKVSLTMHTLKISDYIGLCKVKVVSLIILTAIIGMFLATPELPPMSTVIAATLGIALASSSAAVFNHVIDQKIDHEMLRTRKRPLPEGRVTSRSAVTFGVILGIVGISTLLIFVNTLTAILTFFAMIGYAVIYTIYLKRRTPYNIVIGGAAGAAPPLLGWSSVTNSIDQGAVILFLIIFFWTPPHFWALAIYRKNEYAKVHIPMLPVTHGNHYTRIQILIYTLTLIFISLLPYLTGMSGMVYLLSALTLGFGFLYYSISMLKHPDNKLLPMKAFKFSINYLMLLFIFLLVDHYLPLAFS